MSISINQNMFVKSFQESNQAIIQTIFWLKIVFTMLPVAWIFGILPPVDGLVLFVLEQCYIFIYGGTATANNLR